MNRGSIRFFYTLIALFQENLSVLHQYRTLKQMPLHLFNWFVRETVLRTSNSILLHHEMLKKKKRFGWFGWLVSLHQVISCVNSCQNQFNIYGIHLYTVQKYIFAIFSMNRKNTLYFITGDMWRFVHRLTKWTRRCKIKFCTKLLAVHLARMILGKAWIYGVSGNLVVCYLTSVLFLCFTLSYFAGYSSRFMMAAKELYGKKTGKEMRKPRYLLYFDFFLGSTTIDEIIPESKWNGCV